MVLIDFAALPPETNSGWMYTGPGSGPLLSAAAGWASLATEIGSATHAYRGVVTGLTDEAWHGPTASAMSAAAEPYVNWMATTADLAMQVAGNARSAAAAYEQAFAMTVPPPVIAANRATLTALIAANLFGQNAPAIAVTEAHYAEMWAQDATAMYGYAAASAAVTTPTPFAAPRQNTSMAGRANQLAAVGQADAGNTTAQIAHAVQALAAGPAQTSDAVTQSLIDLFTSPLVTQVDALFGNLTPMTSLFSGASIWGSAGVFGIVPFVSAWVTQIQTSLGAAAAAAAASVISDVSGPGLGSTLVGSNTAGTGWPVAGGSPMAAELGRAVNIGGLSVPPAWDTPKIKLASLAAAPPAPAEPGFYGGVPPIGSVVNSPNGADPHGRSRPGSAQPAGAAAPDATTRHGDAAPPTSEEERRRTEREELEGLRKAIREVSSQTDMLEEQAAILLKKAMQ